MQFITPSSSVDIYICFRCWLVFLLLHVQFDRVDPSRIFHIIYCLHYLINNFPHNSLSVLNFTQRDGSRGQLLNLTL